MFFCSNCGTAMEEEICPHCVSTGGTHPSGASLHAADFSFLVHPNERPYFKLVLVASILIYLGLVVSIVGIVYIASRSPSRTRRRRRR